MEKERENKELSLSVRENGPNIAGQKAKYFDIVLQQLIQQMKHTASKIPCFNKCQESTLN